jgi:fructokinase
VTPPPAQWRIGVDLGGTKIEALALSPEGDEVGRRRVATPRHDYQGTLHAIRDLARGLIRDFAISGLAGIGIGIPGSLSPASSLVRNANSVWLNGKPLRRDLEAALSLPVIIENDANCFALSEAMDGAARHARSVFGIILGTGVGGGLVLGKRVMLGRNAIAGEWGHNPLPWPKADELPGPPCYCGKSGCIETFLSGPALERQYFEAAGEGLSAAEIAARAEAGEDLASSLMRLYAKRLARALASVINILDPDVIVFGGGLSNLDGLRQQARALLPEFVFSDVCETEFVKNSWGDSSGVRGAAWLTGN